MAGGRKIRVALLAVVVLAWSGTLDGSAAAAPGDYRLVTCANAPHYEADAFQVGRTTPLMKAVPDCTPRGTKTTGILTGNWKREGGSVPSGENATARLLAPLGTHFTTLTWSGEVKREDCRYALQLWADGPGADTQVIKHLKADPLHRHHCVKPPPGRERSRVIYQAKKYEEPGKNISGTTQIAQRAICRAPRGESCSRSHENWIKTTLAVVTVHDDLGPTAEIIKDAPLAMGAWVGGEQRLNYGGADNIGIRLARAFIGGAEQANDLTRDCDPLKADDDVRRYTKLVPCTNLGNFITVRTQQIKDGSYELFVQTEDPGGLTGNSEKVIARIDNTAPARVDVGLDGGDAWRNHNDFTALWANPPEPDRAPITSVRYTLCPAAGGPCTGGEQQGTDVSRLAIPVPAPGQWTVALWRVDSAGNASESNASVPVALRYDPDAPQLAFEPPLATDPTRVSVTAKDALSGVASGSIELAREGSSLWQGLVTDREGDRLVTRIDDVALPAGTYLLRARATDGAGNEATTDRRVDGQAMVLTLPLRIAAHMEAGIARQRGGRHPVRQLVPAVRMRYARPVRVAGRLVAPDGDGVAGAEVQVLDRNEATTEHPVDLVRTGADGRFEYETTADNSRTLRFLHAGSPLVLPASAEVTVLVPAATTVRVSRRSVRNGDAVRFSGRLRGLPPPPGGKLVELQVRFPKGWQTFRTARTDAGGKWSARYRFMRTSGSVRYRFRAHLPHEAGYPFETGKSHVLGVDVRGPQ